VKSNDAVPSSRASPSTSHAASAKLRNPARVLVSPTVVDLVAGSGTTFDDRGEHELKGIPAAWRLFAVTA
jgi:class 3 adenylate cyclase